MLVISYHGEVPTRIKKKKEQQKKTVRDDKDYPPRAILGKGKGEGTGREDTKLKGAKEKKRQHKLVFITCCRPLREEYFFQNKRMIGCPFLFVCGDRSGKGGGKPDGFAFSFHTFLFVYPRTKKKRLSVFFSTFLVCEYFFVCEKRKRGSLPQT